eukprot:6508552-Karenia_brevis.AAC.1
MHKKVETSEVVSGINDGYDKEANVSILRSNVSESACRPDVEQVVKQWLDRFCSSSVCWELLPSDPLPQHFTVAFKRLLRVAAAAAHSCRFELCKSP